MEQRLRTISHTWASELPDQAIRHGHSLLEGVGRKGQISHLTLFFFPESRPGVGREIFLFVTVLHDTTDIQKLNRLLPVWSALSSIDAPSPIDTYSIVTSEDI